MNNNLNMTNAEYERQIYREWRKQSERKELKRDVTFFMGMVLLFFLLQVVFLFVAWILPEMVVGEPLYTGEAAEIAEQLLMTGLALFTMGVPCIITYSYAKDRNEILFPFRKMKLKSLISLVALGIGVSVISALSSSVITAIFSLFSNNLEAMEEIFLSPQNPIAVMLSMVNICIMPAVMEELLFRGALLGLLRRYGDMLAIVVSSVGFSLAHGNFLQLPNTLFLGIFLGFLTVKTNSLLPAMFVHFFNNFNVAVLLLVSESYGDEAFMGMAVISYAFMMLLGVLALVYLLNRDKIFFYVKPAKTFLTEKQKYKVTLLSVPSIITIGLGLVIAYGNL